MYSFSSDGCYTLDTTLPLAFAMFRHYRRGVPRSWRGYTIRITRWDGSIVREWTQA